MNNVKPYVSQPDFRLALTWLACVPGGLVRAIFFPDAWEPIFSCADKNGRLSDKKNGRGSGTCDDGI